MMKALVYKDIIKYFKNLPGVSIEMLSFDFSLNECFEY